MARGRVKNVIATLMRQASARKRPASLQGVQIKSDGKYHRLNVTVTPYHDGHGAGELLLIVFETPAFGKSKREEE